MPKSAQPGAKALLAEIYNAEDLDVLLAFYDYPAEHWIHLRTTEPIESTFATVRLRTSVTKGPGSRAAGVAMAFKLIESAQVRWRAVNADRQWRRPSGRGVMDRTSLKTDTWRSGLTGTGVRRGMIPTLTMSSRT